MARKSREDAPRRLTAKVLSGLDLMAGFFEAVARKRRGRYPREGYADYGIAPERAEEIERAIRWIRFIQQKREGE